MAQELRIGMAVIFSDVAHGVRCSALVTAIHGGPIERPPINLAYVNPAGGANEHGAPIVRKNSVVHESKGTAGGLSWGFADAEPTDDDAE